MPAGEWNLLLMERTHGSTNGNSFVDTVDRSYADATT